MKIKNSKIILIIICTLAILKSETLTRASTDESLKREFVVQGEGRLTIDSMIGHMEVISHEELSVSVEIYGKYNKGKKFNTLSTLDDLSIKFEQDKNDIVVSVKHKYGNNFFSRKSIDNINLYFEIRVPKSFNLDLNTAGGDIDISTIDGEVKASTSGGGMRLKNINGNVTIATSGGHISLIGVKGPTSAKTSGGNIEAVRSEGNLNLRTSGGNISIAESDGNVEARTSGGNIDLDTIIHHLNARTSGGNIKAKILAINSDSELKTSGGNIHVYLDPKVQTDLRARCSGGKVSTDIPIVVLGDVSNDRLEGQINGGGPALILQTSGGSIRIKELGAL